MAIWLSCWIDQASIARALEVGKEWLGEDHPAVACLKARVAIHHGRLPSPFLRELETLLSDGILKVDRRVADAFTGPQSQRRRALVPALYRAAEMIKGEELRTSPAAPVAPLWTLRASSSTSCSISSAGGTRNGGRWSLPPRLVH